MSTQPLLGITAIARRLGLSRQRVHILAERDDFPAPAHELDNGRVWAADAVEAWIGAHPKYDHNNLAVGDRCPTCGQVVAA